MAKNQCDGCKLGLLVKDGIHYFKSGAIYMACEKERYNPKNALDKIFKQEENKKEFNHG